MTGLPIGEVRVVPHDSQWASAFEDERQKLLKVLAGVVNKPRIEHIGSTAVTGLVAKPIIDIVIGVGSNAEVSRAVAALVSAGRTYVKGANQPGMLFLAAGEPGSRTFHYHLVIYATPAWRKVIVFRDYLRRHRAAAEEYGAFKAKVAEEFPKDRGRYTAAKGPMLRTIVQRGFAEDQRRRMSAATRMTLLLNEEQDKQSSP